MKKITIKVVILIDDKRKAKVADLTHALIEFLRIKLNELFPEWEPSTDIGEPVEVTIED